MNIFEQMKQDELSDQAELFGKMSPIEYARWRGVAPQLVYYRIRKGKIELTFCPCCGRKVIDVGEADLAFGTKQEGLSKEEEASELDAF